MYSASLSRGGASLPPSQDTRYTLRRPQSANGVRGGTLPSMSVNRFLQSTSLLTRSFDGGASAVGGISPMLMGRLSRPASAGFVTWNSPGVEDNIEADSFVGIDDDVTIASDSQVPQYGAYRTQGTPGAQSIPTRPTSATGVVPYNNNTAQALVWDTPSKSVAGIATSPIVPSVFVNSNHNVVPDGSVNSNRGNPANTLSQSGGAEESFNAEIVDSVAVSTPSKRVNALREATTTARSDATTTQQDVRADEAPTEVAQGPSSLDSSQLKSASTIASRAVSPLLNMALTNKGAIAIKTKVIGIPIPATFADFVERDKFFEAAAAKFAELEFERRLEVHMDQTTRRNALYVAMTKVYLRWAETGLDPSQPDPPSQEALQRMVLQNEQHRRNVDNVVIKEEKARAELSNTLHTALSAAKQTVYLLMEEEAVRAHVQNVFEPERWASLTYYIYHFLETRLVTSSIVWKSWSLAGGVIEREEGWERAMLKMKFEVLVKSLTLAKAEASEANARSVVERDERVKRNAIDYAISEVTSTAASGAPMAVNAVADSTDPVAEVAGAPTAANAVADSTDPVAEVADVTSVEHVLASDVPPEIEVKEEKTASDQPQPDAGSTTSGQIEAPQLWELNDADNEAASTPEAYALTAEDEELSTEEQPTVAVEPTGESALKDNVRAPSSVAEQDDDEPRVDHVLVVDAPPPAVTDSSDPARTVENDGEPREAFAQAGLLKVPPIRVEKPSQRLPNTPNEDSDIPTLTIVSATPRPVYDTDSVDEQ